MVTSENMPFSLSVLAIWYHRESAHPECRLRSEMVFGNYVTFFFLILGFEIRVLCMVGRCSTT
jgi:hypothetical protein